MQTGVFMPASWPNIAYVNIHVHICVCSCMPLPSAPTQIPPSSTLRALFSAATLRPEAARQVLLGHVNAGGLALLYTILLDSAQPEIAAALKVVAGAVGSGR